MSRHIRCYAKFSSLVLTAAAVLGALSVAVAPAEAAVRTVTNGILSVEIEDAGSEAGMFTVLTGASHPSPGETVFYPIGTSYITLRDNTAQEIWANAGGTSNVNIAPYTFNDMQASAVAVTNIPSGFRTTYTLPNWTVVQDAVIAGTTLANTNVRHTVTVNNTSAVTRSYGVRYMWDWQIADNDASYIRKRNPDGAFTDVFSDSTPPDFQAFEEVDDIVTPAFSVFGTVQGGSLTPPPTAPDRVAYVDWNDFYNAPWDYAISGSGADSATVHYWGYTSPLTLAAAASTSFTEYIATEPSAVGVTPPPPPPPSTAVNVPTLSESMTVLLAALVAAASMFYLRRRER